MTSNRPVISELNATPIDRVIAVVCARLGEQTAADLSAETLAAEARISMDQIHALFPTREALLRIVAETASRRKFDFVTRSVTTAPMDHPVAQFVAVIHGVLDWSNEYPDDVRLLERRVVQNIVNQSGMSPYALSIYDLSERILKRAHGMGQLPEHTTIHRIILAFRAYVYGLVGLQDDSQFQRWHNAGMSEETIHELLDEFAGLYLPSYATYLRDKAARAAESA